MNQTISRLVKLLTEEGVSAADAAKSIGAVEKEGGPHSALILKPDDKVFSRVTINPGSAADTPYTVEFEVNGEKALSLKDFEEAYGESHFVPLMRPGQKDRVAFYYEPDRAPYSIAIFASHEDDRVVGVMLRRDKKP